MATSPRAPSRGTDVRDNDIQGRDIRDHTISGADVKESSLAKVPLAGDADTLGGKSAAAFLASDRLVRVGPVALHEGEERVVTTSGRSRGGQAAAHTIDGTHLNVKLESTEAEQLRRLLRGRRRCRVSGLARHDVRRLEQHARVPDRVPGSSASAPSGAAPVGLAFVGINVGTTDCLVNGMMLP